MGLFRDWWSRPRRAPQPRPRSGTPCRIEVVSTDSRQGMIAKVQARGFAYADAAALVDMLVEDRQRRSEF